MGRSRKATPIMGNGTARSERGDKRVANRRLRRRVRQALANSPWPSILPHRREVSYPWTMAKDGKRWFDREQFPEEMRK